MHIRVDLGELVGKMVLVAAKSDHTAENEPVKVEKSNLFEIFDLKIFSKNLRIFYFFLHEELDLVEIPEKHYPFASKKYNFSSKRPVQSFKKQQNNIKQHFGRGRKNFETNPRSARFGALRRGQLLAVPKCGRKYHLARSI